MKLPILNRSSPEASATGQTRVDAIMAAARASVGPPAVRSIYRAPMLPAPRASRSSLDHRIQEELDFTQRTLEALGEQLANDPILLTRYQGALQGLDMAAQTLGHLARVIGAEDKIAAAEQTPMESLKARLLRGVEAMIAGQSVLDLQRSSSNPFGG